MVQSPEYLQELQDFIPRLRRFAFCMCGRVDRGDDCVASVLNALADRPQAWRRGPLEATLFALLRQELLTASGGTLVAPSRRSDVQTVSLGADEAFLRLEPAHKEVLLLAVTEGLSLATTARILRISAGEAKRRLAKARRAYHALVEAAWQSAGAEGPSDGDAGGDVEPYRARAC